MMSDWPEIEPLPGLPGWEIIHAKRLFMMMGEGWEHDTYVDTQVRTARERGTPLLVCLQAGVDVPDGLFDGLDVRIERWSTHDEMCAASRRLLSSDC